jgi:thioredoxin reductase
MDIMSEELVVYMVVALFVAIVLAIYILKQRRQSQIVERKIAIAKLDGLYEPVSLHPVVDVNSCIQSGACIKACPEHDILGIRNGKATVINASQCVGHGACFHACPTEAISLRMGTETRGVELPHVNEKFETNVKGIFIAGEMGGMGLIKNAVEQGKQAVDNLVKDINKEVNADYDLVVVGAGPAGLSASLQAKKLGLKCLTVEQESLGGTVYNFPRAKIVMTSPMDIPLNGKIKLTETSKDELLALWNKVLGDNGIVIQENIKVEEINKSPLGFEIKTKQNATYTTQKVLLAIGRRGTPRKLGISGEELPKVAYRLLEPELLKGKKVVVVGGGDSAIESALLLMEDNEVTLSYRKDKFSRLKPKNNAQVKEAIENNRINVLLNSNLVGISEKDVKVSLDKGGIIDLANDLVYIFAGGELPTQFLKNVGIEITKKFGEVVLTKKKT